MMKKIAKKVLVTVGLGLVLMTTSTVYAAGDDLLAGCSHFLIL